MTAPQVERLYLDFDSFFASAEQHFNPDLRGQPLGVVPLDSPHTSCIAVSREAKARGVKSGASIREARAILPDMVFVIARHDAYVRLHKRILDVVGSILPVAKVRSIDEVVCHLTPAEAAQGKALSDRIKTALRDAFSPALTCSIGMAPTEMLAKVGAEMNKPDGFSLIEARDLPGCLSHLDLRDLPGISKGIGARLAAAGVRDIAGLWRLAPKQARKLWGNVEGERFWNELHGFHAERPETKKSMYGHGRVLPRDGRAPEQVEACARQLLLSAARRLRRDDLRATQLTLGFRSGRGPDEVQWSWHDSFAAARDDRTFTRALSKGLAEARRSLRFSPRAVHVTLHGLASDDEITGDLFSGALDEGADDAIREKWEKVSDLMDSLRASHGAKALSLGVRAEIQGGYVGAKIAFGRIPDESDFSEAPTRDEDTRFLSY
ncbi:Y-family DNA polymerase [Tropicibacter naphthalenivorans]|uniref:DNA-directed DNA polymerase n=1 Tax=Tropicibacter naphthalenivorans TaxID=441103 RepID=A0A0N7M186_9RHOB|nr:type VI secretion protein ImpB [Tropicibacter naphthalenivorans]CUH82569.1 DNA polymerase IV [Tropicibacter naphthalenivorans]SMD09298.1 DNA polymerase-4 [Tropicibacter naphthalenivorans]